MIRYKTILLIGCFLLLAVGCIYVPLASREADSEAKQLTPDNEKALIYVYDVGGTGVLKPVKVNNKFIGRIDGDAYLFFYSYPGQVTVAMRTGKSPNKDITVDFNVSGGSIYYIKLDPAASVFGTDHFNLVGSSVGKTDISTMRLALMKSVFIAGMPINSGRQSDSLRAP